MTTAKTRRSMNATCAVAVCDRAVGSRGLCAAHYARLLRTGDPGTSAIASSAVRTQAERFWDKVDRRGPDECWPWTGCLTSTGYGALRPAGKRTGAVVKAHRYSAELAGMDIEGMHVLHSCDNPACVNPAHLRPGTDADNMADAVKRNRLPRGEARPTARITEIQAYAIRELVRSGHPAYRIAEAIGCSPGLIYHIKKGNTWRHLGPVCPPSARDLIQVVVESITGEALDSTAVAA